MASTWALLPIQLFVFLLMTEMPPATPTPTSPPIAKLPLTTLTTVVSSAWTTTLALAVAEAFCPIYASVVSDSTETPAVTPTATLPEPAPVTEIESVFSSASACTTTESSALTLAPSPTKALVLIVATPTSAPTPTPTSPPIASEPAAPMRLKPLTATTFTSPCEVMLPAGLAPGDLT